MLGLQDNALSDEGIRRMTSPIRMFKKGPLNLHKIDISGSQSKWHEIHVVQSCQFPQVQRSLFIAHCVVNWDVAFTVEYCVQVQPPSTVYSPVLHEVCDVCTSV